MKNECQPQKAGLKKWLYHEVNTEKVLNEENILKLSLALACCALVFDLFLGYFSMFGTPTLKKDFITPAIQTTSRATANVIVTAGTTLQYMPKAFSLTEGPLIQTFEITEYIGQSINETISNAISFTQQSLNTTIATSLASTY